MLITREVEIDLSTEDIWDEMTKEERMTIFEWFLEDYPKEAGEILADYNYKEAEGND